MHGPANRIHRLDRRELPKWLPDDAVIARHVAARDRWLRHCEPRYQLELIKDLAALMPAGPCRILDVGAGSGLIGEVIATLFPGKSVVGVDVAPVALPKLRIPLLRFDGRRLPFADRSFDCVMFCNVLHHVRTEARAGLLSEALRVTGGGPVVVKDHLRTATSDGFRLWLLDVLGNVPRGAMVSAHYLGPTEWAELLHEVDCAGVALPTANYRRGLWSRLFPCELEISFRIGLRRAGGSG